MVALCRRAELHQHRAEHADVERLRQRGGGAIGFVEQDQAFHRAEVGAAVALGPVRRGPATLVEDALPGHCVLLARRMAGTQAFADL